MRPAIQSVIFTGDGAFDVQYAEQDEIHPKCTVVRQAMVAGGVVDIEPLLDMIRDLLDEALAARYDDPSERIVRH